MLLVSGHTGPSCQIEPVGRGIFMNRHDINAVSELRAKTMFGFACIGFPHFQPIHVITPHTLDLCYPSSLGATGKRVWRNDMYRLEGWEPDAGETEHGLRTEFADGIYIGTVHEDTPTVWLHL